MVIGNDTVVDHVAYSQRLRSVGAESIGLVFAISTVCVFIHFANSFLVEICKVELSRLESF